MACRAERAEAELADAINCLKQIEQAKCCGEFVNGCPRHAINGDTDNNCPITIAKHALKSKEIKP
jgi:hypothetical protein